MTFDRAGIAATGFGTALCSMARDIVFVVEQRQLRAGSTHLRGVQLSQLFAEVAADYGRKVRLALAEDDIRDCIAIVNKSALMRREHDVPARLAAAGCLVLMDFVDSQVTPSIAQEADGFIACSALQARALRQNWPERPVVHLPHHIDLGIPEVACQWDRFACAYFGNVDAARHIAPLVQAGLLTHWVPGTANKNGWYRALPDFNLHYAFRPREMWSGGFKPFTKGFVAAHCGAAILVASSDDEAAELLGTDYPLRMPDDASPAQIMAKLAALQEDFRGGEWQVALGRMQRLRSVSSASYQRALIRAFFFEEGPFSHLIR